MLPLLGKMTNENPAERYRLFIAVAVPDSVKTEIEKVQGKLQSVVPSNCVRWTRREQFHLTLKFLGNVEAPRVEELAEALRQTCKDFPALHVQARRIGFFPGPRRPRVIWVGMEDLRGQLSLLQGAVESISSPFTQEKGEGEFAGHVTLGRVKFTQRPHAEALARMALDLADAVFGEWTVEEVELIRSQLSSEGPAYTTIAAARLGGTPR